MKKTNNWFIFAEDDFKMAHAAFEEKIYNQVCFHSQQAVEKLLKGFILVKKQSIPKTHFLIDLLGICIEFDKKFESLKEDCSILDDYYIPTRYPDALPGALPKGLPLERDASDSLKILQKVKEFIYNKL